MFYDVIAYTDTCSCGIVLFIVVRSCGGALQLISFIMATYNFLWFPRQTDHSRLMNLISNVSEHILNFEIPVIRFMVLDDCVLSGLPYVYATRKFVSKQVLY